MLKQKKPTYPLGVWP